MIKQSRSDSCVAAVLAKIVGQPEQYVFDWFRFQDPPFSDEDAFIFLAHHGIYLSCAVILGDSQTLINSKSKFDIEFDFSKRIAYLIVKSNLQPGETHAVLWNGKHVLDPVYKEPQRIEDYIIERFYPLMQSEVRHRERFGF